MASSELREPSSGLREPSSELREQSSELKEFRVGGRKAVWIETGQSFAYDGVDRPVAEKAVDGPLLFCFLFSFEVGPHCDAHPYYLLLRQTAPSPRRRGRQSGEMPRMQPDRQGSCGGSRGGTHSATSVSPTAGSSSPRRVKTRRVKTGRAKICRADRYRIVESF